MFETDYGRQDELSQRYKSGANWFYWIAGLTLITSIIGLMGVGWRFFLSLGTTQLIDAIAAVTSESLGNATKVIAIVLDIFITAMFAAFGVLANKKQLWAYIVGMAVFLMDGLVSLAIFDWIGIIVHGIVLVVMFRGYQAGRELVAIENAMAQAAVQAPPAPAPAPAATI
jgi:hypothetical protein